MPGRCEQEIPRTLEGWGEQATAGDMRQLLVVLVASRRVRSRDDTSVLNEGGFADAFRLN
jgi:hypothetical protein